MMWAAPYRALPKVLDEKSKIVVRRFTNQGLHWATLIASQGTHNQGEGLS